MGAGLWPQGAALGAHCWLCVGLFHWRWFCLPFGGMVVIMTKDEALRLAFEALELANYKVADYCNGYTIEEVDDAITAIKAALEANEFNPDWDAMAVMVEEQQRMAKELWQANNRLHEVAKHCANVEAALKAKDELMGWKLVPIEPTNEMLKAMDECSTEGYDERLPAGIASSVYMAAVEVAPKPPQQKINNEPKCVAIVEVFEKDWRLDYMALPVGKHKLYAQQYLYTTLPPQRTWVGLTDEEIGDFASGYRSGRIGSFVELTEAIEAKLKEKNT